MGEVAVTPSALLGAMGHRDSLAIFIPTCFAMNRISKRMDKPTASACAPPRSDRLMALAFLPVEAVHRHSQPTEHRCRYFRFAVRSGFISPLGQNPVPSSRCHSASSLADLSVRIVLTLSPGRVPFTSAAVACAEWELFFLRKAAELAQFPPHP